VFGVLKETMKFPKPGFLDAQFNKWLHKATFWYWVRLQTSLNAFPFLICSFSACSYCLKFLQLEVEALKLYIATISDLKLMIKEVHNLMTFEEYIHH
jgi:hypothetical protein